MRAKTMGEYAVRKSDHERIKIGTCESMYYLRYEDRDKIIAQSGNVDPMKEATGLFFRLPFPDEDDVRPGDYKDYNRGLRLYQSVNAGTASSRHQDFTDESTMESPGTMQLRHETSGLLLNVPCYHGHKLPDVVEPMKAFWNGKGHSLELAFVKATADGILPVVRCRHCGSMWRYAWSDIWEYIEVPMRNRLRVYFTTEVTA